MKLIHCGLYTSIRKRPIDLLRYTWEMPLAMRGIPAMVTANNIDLLYVCGPRLILPAAVIARTQSLPLLFHCHHRIVQRSAMAVAGRALHWSNAGVIACCNFAAEPLRKYVADPVRIVYNGVPDMPYTKRPRQLKNAPRIGVIGRIEPEKGQIDFIKAARSVLADCPGARFVIAGAPMLSGSAYFDHVKEASRDLPCDFLGWQDDISSVFATLDMLVVPSSAIDSTPRVILEAFAARVPVVAYPSGGIPEILEDNVSGFLASDVSPRSLAARICNVLQMNETDRQAVVARARALWQGSYRVARFQEEITQAIAHMC